MHNIFYIGPSQHIVILSVPVAGILAIIFTHHFSKNFFQILHTQRALILMFVLLTYTYPLGTNTNYWNPITGYGFFWMLAVLIFLNLITDNIKRNSILLYFSFAVQWDSFNSSP